MVLASPSLRSQQQARAVYRNLQDDFDVRVSRLANQLSEKRISLATWVQSMRAEIRQHHITAATIGGGDMEHDPAFRGMIDQQIQEQMQYFDRWVSQLANGDVETRSAAGIANRARLYGHAGGETFNRAVASSIGVPVLPFYPKRRTVCKANCRCSWRIIQRGEGDFDCFWDLGVNEHCPTCRARAKTANPLKVRGGQIVKPERYQKATLYA